MQRLKIKYELCPCGCGLVLKPGQRHHSDPTGQRCEDGGTCCEACGGAHEAASHAHDCDKDGCSCEYEAADCSCAHSEGKRAVDRNTLIRIIAGAAVYAAALIFASGDLIRLVLFMAAYLMAGGDVLLRAAKNIFRGRIFDENLLMSVATIGALAIREYPEAVAVMLFYQIGELFQGYAVGQSRRSIAKLMDIRPDYANLLKDGEEQRVPPQQVSVGDVIVVRPGEKAPLDGVVLQGSSFVDTSALTGESVPRPVGAGESVYAGFINQSGLMKVRVEREFAQSAVARILELVQNASARKAPAEQFISRFARYYTPVVVGIAALIAIIPPLIAGGVFSEWLYRALVFLVISCPCALVISIPLSFFGGIGAASREGVLVKGGNYLEALREAATFVFDKTGTLTEGVFQVSEIRTYGALSSADVLSLAAHIECFSSHPIAASILDAYAASGGQPDKTTVTHYEEIPGFGLKALIRGKEVLAGSRRFMEISGIPAPEGDLPGTAVYIAAEGMLAGALAISDRIRPDAKRALAALRAAGVRETVMLTGDRQDAAQRVADELGVDAFYAELLPHDKVAYIERLTRQSNGKVAFVGDGINDAPVLARADIGIAMGGLGSDAAVEAADIVIMDDRLTRLADAIRISRRTRHIVFENIAFAMAVKAAVLALGAGGLATMWEAVFADAGVALLAVLNALRVMRRSRS
jgi:Cd2+/Zn2+-exporting ATPase